MFEERSKNSRKELRSNSARWSRSMALNGSVGGALSGAERVGCLPEAEDKAGAEAEIVLSVVTSVR